MAAKAASSSRGGFSSGTSRHEPLRKDSFPHRRNKLRHHFRLPAGTANRQQRFSPTAPAVRSYVRRGTRRELFRRRPELLMPICSSQSPSLQRRQHAGIVADSFVEREAAVGFVEPCWIYLRAGGDEEGHDLIVAVAFWAGT